ncbi:MAG: BamA/TamA family outer membrane protein [Bacteroidetes bacterium]|nr:BamA/TamA family outer membrane protein [Bacteroidota bacterium]
MPAKDTAFFPCISRLPRTLVRWVFALWVLASLAGCEATRYLPEGRQLVKTQPRFTGQVNLTADELETYIKTHRNRRVVLPKVYLHVYNTGEGLLQDSGFVKHLFLKLDKDSLFLKSTARWMKRVVGEPPELVDRPQLIRDCKNLESFYFSKGFFNARVRYQVKPVYWNNRKANVIFHVEENEVAIIHRVAYMTQDTALLKLLEATRRQAQVRPSQTYDETRISEERSRITELMRNNGYYAFGLKDVSFTVDTSHVELADSLLRPRVRDRILFYQKRHTPYRLISIQVHLPDSNQVYTLDSVTVRLVHDLTDSTRFSYYGPALTDAQRKAWQLPMRRLSIYNSARFLTTERTRHILNYNMLERRLRLHKDSLFRLDDYRLTVRQLQQLGVFSNTFVRYEPGRRPNSLHAAVDLSMSNRYFHQERVELFQSQDRRINSNLPGLGGTIQLANRNAFRRAEQLDLQLTGNVFLYSPDADQQPSQLFYQYGISVNFNAPHFYLLDTLALRATRLNPKWLSFYERRTTISLNFNQELNQQFQRQNLILSYQYAWSHTPFRFGQDRGWQSIFKPLVVTYVNTFLEPAFEEQLYTITDAEGNLLSENDLRVRLFTLRDFQPRFVTASTYIRTYTRQYNGKQRQAGWFFRAQVDLGGNLPSLIDRLATGEVQHPVDGTKVLGKQNLQYSQFYRLSLEGRISKRSNARQQWVARMLIGAGRGFNGSGTIPLEYRFFSGGTNSVRGWQSNTLGPGTYPFDLSRIISIGGEVKFEVNAEYRVKAVSPLELAFFIDAGNVWFWQGSSFQEPRAYLNKHNLELGVAAGIGLRFDFDFIILAFDIGQQVYAPDIRGFVVQRFPKDIGANRIQYNLGIGYPF